MEVPSPKCNGCFGTLKPDSDCCARRLVLHTDFLLRSDWRKDFIVAIHYKEHVVYSDHSPLLLFPRHTNDLAGTNDRADQSESHGVLCRRMEFFRYQHRPPNDDLSRRPKTNCETSDTEESSRMAAPEPAARIRELEDEARGLRRMVCYLLTKNESLRQRLQHRNEAERAPV
jgi:hypothetical protein